MRSRPTDDLMTRVAKLEEKMRRLGVHNFGGGDPGGGTSFTPSWAAYSMHYGFWVQDPAKDFRYWMVLDDTTGHDVGDSGDGWTTVDHRGTGKPTLMVPPAPGAYAFGASFGYFVVKSGGPYAIKADHGPAIIYQSAGSYGIELHMDEIEVEAAALTNTYFGNALSGFAPTLQNPSTDEYGFAVYTDLSTPFSGGPSDVHGSAQAPMLWAHKVA